jgi:maleylpyruvate isomerase
MTETRVDDISTQTELIDLLGRSTDCLTQTVQGLKPHEIGMPSSLPGWSRGHLLTHIANNAEGLTRVILGALSGRALPMYSSADARESDIEAGATRHGSVIVAHAQLATTTLDSAIATVSDWEAPAVFETVTGAVEQPLTEVLRMRLREVAIHHVDLAVDHRFDDEDSTVIIELIRDAARRFSSNGTRSIDLLVEGNVIATITDDRQPPATSIVDLPGGAMFGWLTGRDTPQRGFPVLPRWG